LRSLAEPKILRATENIRGCTNQVWGEETVILTV
jgi:hypothetical protein